MKDSSVAPAGLFDPRRQKRLLEGLTHRFQNCLHQQQTLRVQHAKERETEESSFSQQRSQKTNLCRQQRYQMLQQWDDAEEKLTCQYETSAIKQRKELSRLAALFRRKAQEEKAGIQRKVDARKQAVQQQYENRKNQPGLQNRKEVKFIDDSLQEIRQNVEWARALTIRRLDRLPEVPPTKDADESLTGGPPDTVQQSVENIAKLTRQCKRVVEEMQTGMAYKTADSFYLPAGVAVMVVLTSVVIFFVGPKPPWIPMMIGALVAGVIGFIIYAILLWPLKKMTRVLYPRAERLARAAEDCAATGRKISTKQANDASAELIQRRDTHLESSERWREEQLVEMQKKLQEEQEARRQKLLNAIAEADRKFSDDFQAVGAQMRTKADQLAQHISQSLAQTDQELELQRQACATRRLEQLQYLANRLKEGASRGMNRILLTDERVSQRFPDWEQVLTDPSPTENVTFLPLGWLSVDQSLREALQGASQQPAAHGSGNGSQHIEDIAELLANAEIPQSLPVVLHRRLHSGVVIRAPQAHLDQAIDLAHQIIWRLISGAAPSRAKLTLIDPLGRGQHFTSFMALADHDPAIVGHRVWTTDAKVDERLAELAHHVEDVLQASLRDRFERIEDYNEVAGSMAEPYRAVAAVGFPEGLTREGYKHLRALIESGLRCGIFTVLVCDQSKQWPADMPLPTTDKMLYLAIGEDGQWRFESEGLEGLPFQPAWSPPLNLRSDLIEKIGQATVAASRVEIPLDSILRPDGQAAGNTDDGIEIEIGSQGANRNLSLDLGEGVKQHVLIAGKTGSGKSTLLHSIITSGAYRYRPDQLQFYLLDFKKGVEFKPYAESGLPHARVIGIESEREFGRSVLQRLDEELQQRGEAFRAQGVQELSEYREKSGQPLSRILLVVDEFQELFVRDDRLAADCAMLLDRLVRQGRSFGMHVVLSSQSLAGAYSLPRATLGQMAVRIAMHCSESDAALILADDNTAARLISRPGEAIYNDAGGLVEGNQPFQVAWLSSSRHRELLDEISGRDELYSSQLAPPVVFEGNRPCRWTKVLAEAALAGENPAAMRGLLGEAVEIGPPLAIELSRNAGRNVLMITPPQSRGAILAASLSGIAKANPDLELLYFDGTRADDAPSLAPWLSQSGMKTTVVRPRDSDAEMVRLAGLVKERGDEAEGVKPIIVIVDPLERFRDLRQDESFSFSLDAAAQSANGAAAFQEVLRDGPGANVFVILVCGSAETLSRWLPRASQHDLELRVLGRMNASDSSMLIDTPIAADLSAATMLLYDDSDGRITKFRQCDLPEADTIRQWLGS
ncbi:MAG: AAA family ATPase [Pirellulales bacterium]|nr:AAA family ATPase [Pirellulales bacterium]